MKFLIGLIPTLSLEMELPLLILLMFLLRNVIKRWKKIVQPTEKIKGEKAYCYINVLSSHFCRAAVDLFKAVSLREKKMLLAGIVQRKNYNS